MDCDMNHVYVIRANRGIDTEILLYTDLAFYRCANNRYYENT